MLDLGEDRQDLSDFADFQNCFTGDGAVASASCKCTSDLDGDGDVDVSDLQVAVSLLDGPNKWSCP